jgi:hypothetical protein
MFMSNTNFLHLLGMFQGSHDFSISGGDFNIQVVAATDQVCCFYLSFSATELSGLLLQHKILRVLYIQCGFFFTQAGHIELCKKLLG